MASPPTSAWQDVRIWGVQDRRADRRATKPWVVRWAVDARTRGKTFRTKAEAEAFRSELMLARRLREDFDTDTAEPLSWSPAADESFLHSWARRWLGEQWPEWQPRTRASAIEALARFVPLAATSRAPSPPDGMRRYLTTTLRPDATIDIAHPCEEWLQASMPSLLGLNRDTLARVDTSLGRSDADGLLAPSTANRYRKVARACLRRAVELDIIPKDPWPPATRGRSQRKAMRTRRAIDVRVLPEPPTMRRAIDAISTHQPGSHTYRVMTAVAYYAGLRPSEVVMLRPRALNLPPAGWGRIDVTEADVSMDEPGLPKTGERSVPVPPTLVRILTEWLDLHNFADHDLIFRTRTGRLPTASNWSRAWHRALRSIGQPTLRLYDCRHAAATTWLRAGVPLGEVARRLGHSVETLVSTYVGALEEDETLGNSRIEAALADTRTHRTKGPAHDVH